MLACRTDYWPTRVYRKPRSDMQSPYVSPMSRKRISSFAPDLAKRERKTTSPLTDLPLELLQCILGYLSFHEMRTVRRVCTKLRELVRIPPMEFYLRLPTSPIRALRYRLICSLKRYDSYRRYAQHLC